MLVHELIKKLEDCSPSARVAVFNTVEDISGLLDENGGEDVKNIIESECVVAIIFE